MIAPLKAALTAEDGIWQPKSSNVNFKEVGEGMKFDPVRTLEELVASSDEMKPSFPTSEGKSTVVVTVRCGWGKSVNGAQRVCICMSQAASST